MGKPASVPHASYDEKLQICPECDEWNKGKNHVTLSINTIHQFVLLSQKRIKEKTNYLNDPLMSVELKNMKIYSRQVKKLPKETFTMVIGLHDFADMGEDMKALNDKEWKKICQLNNFAQRIFFIAPRAVEETIEAWKNKNFMAYLYMFIEDLVLLEYIDPNRVYLFGWGKSGCAAFYIANIIPYRFACVAAIDSCIEDLPIENLINLPFLFQPSTTSSNQEVYSKWVAKIKILQQQYPAHFTCWLSGYDENKTVQEMFDWMMSHIRDPCPKRLLWVQSNSSCLSENNYWISVPPKTARFGTRVEVLREDNTLTFTLNSVESLIFHLGELNHLFYLPFYVRINSVKKGLIFAEYTFKLTTDSFQLYKDPYLRFIGEGVISNPDLE